MSATPTIRTAALGHGLQLGALLLRGGAYALFAAVVGRAEFGAAVLGGLLLGDLAAAAFGAVTRPADERPQALAELAVLALAGAWARAWLDWPAEPAGKAILGLAALGIFVARVGRNTLTRLTPSDDGFA